MKMSCINRAPRTLAGAVLTAILVVALPLQPSVADPGMVCDNAERDVFADVASDSTHAANIDCIAAYGIAVGVGGGNYDPSGWVSRGQMASFLVSFVEVAMDQPATAPSSPTPFSDIDGTTHANNIEVAASLDITVGRTPTTYEPTVDVTRAQMASLVRNAIEAAGVELPDDVPDAFSDDDGSVHTANIDALAAAGIVRGTGDDTYDPDGFVTRAQMASFLASAAGLLQSQDAWLAPPIPVDGPQAVLVARAADTSDTLKVRWDRTVSVTATGPAFTVLPDTDETASATLATDDGVIATGTEVTHDATTSEVVLDGSLEVDEVYWLDLEAGIATDGNGYPNDEQRIAFTFAVGEADDGTGGGSGDGGADGGNEPSIVGAVTDPVQNRIVVTFDDAVTCPSSAGGLAAWTFVNSSTDGGGDHADGLPDTIAQAETPSTTCDLLYTGDGVGDGDFGTLSYTQPADETDRVRTADGTALATTTGADVTDGLAPTFDGASGYAETDTIELAFSEPVLCLSLHVDDLLVENTQTSEVFAVTGFECEGVSSLPDAQLAGGSLEPTDEIRVSVVDDIFDESEDNTVAHSAKLTFVQ